MSRLLAIDYGIKRTGIAVSDPLQIIASGLTTIETGKLMQFLKKYITEENVAIVLIGMPKTLRNEATDATPFVEKFIEAFKREIPTIPIKIVDERFTSKMAFQTMIDSGMKKKDRQNKALVDEISATIILQGYMSSF
jgi:putative Holliday junction resolvase